MVTSLIMSTHIDKFSASGTHFRDYQLDCYNKLHTAHDQGETKCLCLMFCGTGKTRVFYTFILDFKFSIVVLPTLALVDQFISDYVTDSSMNCSQFDFSFLRVSSGNDIPHGRKATVLFTRRINDNLQKTKTNDLHCGASQ